MSWMTASPVFQSRFPVGSSARRSFGSLTRARAMATRCCSPPESWPGFWPALSSRNDLGEQGRAAPGASRLFSPGNEKRQEDVFQGAELRQKMEGLEDEPDLPVPEAGLVPVRSGR